MLVWHVDQDSVLLLANDVIAGFSSVALEGRWFVSVLIFLTLGSYCWQLDSIDLYRLPFRFLLHLRRNELCETSFVFLLGSLLCVASRIDTL